MNGRENSTIDGPLPSGGGTPLRQEVKRAAFWRRFCARRTALAGMIVIAALFLVAALAPFLAGNRPLVLIRGKGVELPVFQAFTRADFVWLAGPACVLVGWFWRKAARRFCGGRGGGRPGRSLLGAFSFAIMLLAVLVAALVWPDRLARTDFRPYRDGVLEAEFCLFPPVPFSPEEVPLANYLEPPSAAHWLGTDREGADLLARVIHGTRVSLLIGFIAAGICVLIGIVLGALAGYFGGWVDMAVSRLIEVFTCFPTFFAILAVVSFFPPSIFWIMLVIGLFRWTQVARLMRGEFLKSRELDYVAAARAMGLSHRRVIFRHILPNSLAPVLVAATFGVAGAILIESGLSFLGIGPASCQSWGRLLAEMEPHFVRAWWLCIPPGAAVFVTVTAFHLTGDGLRDAFDPKEEGQR